MSTKLCWVAGNLAVLVASVVSFCGSANGAVVGRAISASGDLNLTTYDVNADGDTTTYLGNPIPLPGFDNDGAFGNEGYRPDGLSANNMFGIGARGTTTPGGDPTVDDDSYPIALLDDSLSIFPADVAGIIRGGNVANGVPFDNAPFFGIVNVDLDPTGTPPSDPPGSLDTEQATWLFNVSGSTGALTVKIDIAAMGDFEATGTASNPLDVFNFDVSLDGGAFAPLFTGSVDEAVDQTYTMEGGAQPVLNDPMLMDGIKLSNAFQTFSKDVGSATSTLLLRVTAFNNATAEAFAFRNILIEDGGVGPTELTGDYNDDDVVDAADYAVWRDNFGSTTADLNGDLLGPPIDEDQYLQWQANFGATPQGAGSNTAIPEPSTIALLLMAVAMVALRRVQ